PIPPVLIIPEAFDLIKNLVENNVKLYPMENNSTMLTAKEARAKTDEKVNGLLLALSLEEIKATVLKEAALGRSRIEWHFGENRKLGFEVKAKLEDLGYKVDLINNWKALEIEW